MDRLDTFNYLSIAYDLSRPRAFIFDLDDTLVESKTWHLKAYERTLCINAHEIWANIEQLKIEGKGTEEVLRDIGITDDKLKILTTEKRKYYKEYIEAGRIKACDGAYELLELLQRKGRILILVSSASKDIVDATLKSVKMEGFFKGRIVTREMTYFGKPSPDPFLCALRLFQVKPSDAVTIEDAKIGIDASIMAGVGAILVNNRSAPPGIPTFETIRSLHKKVERDFEKSFEKRDIPIAPAGDFVWDSTIGEEPPNYHPHSDKELFELLKRAAKGGSLKLFRIGSPLLFRRGIIGLLEDTEKFETLKAATALNNEGIKSIKILLADPNGVEFLRRLDYEHAGSWGIWRIRYEVLRFAKGLFRLLKKRGQPDNFKIGVHNGALLWNVGISGDESVLVRMYGLGTGHDDSKKSEWLTVHEHALAELVCKYWDCVSSDTKTRWINDDYQINPEESPCWPSLYKGNAVLSSERDFDKEDYLGKVQKEVWKICRNKKDHDSEQKLLKEVKRPLEYFRPVELVLSNIDIIQFGRIPLCIKRISGVSLFEIQCAVSKIGQLNRESASRLLGQLLVDSINSLREFREVVGNVFRSEDLSNYNYGDQLESAIKEVKHLIPYATKEDWWNALEDANDLGGYLMENSKVPFRDAHAKNRLWSTEKTPDELVRYLLDLDVFHRENEIKNSLKDIDFETSAYKVTEYDDAIHILFFENSGVSPFIDNPIKLVEDWWGPVDGEEDKKLFWSTVLARSIRELCRRIWYARTMPNNYVKRYGLEERDFFRKLARISMKELKKLYHFQKYNGIFVLLNRIEEHEEVWVGVGNNYGDQENLKLISAIHPKDCSEKHDDNGIKKIDNIRVPF